MLTKQEENQKLLIKADQRLKQEEDEKRSLLTKLESLKRSSQEMTKELIDSTNSQSQLKLEIKRLGAQLREKIVRQ